MNKFHSTRGTTDSLTSKQAIRKGIADDGGLFVTDELGERTVRIDDFNADVCFRGCVEVCDMGYYVEQCADRL